MFQGNLSEGQVSHYLSCCKCQGSWKTPKIYLRLQKRSPRQRAAWNFSRAEVKTLWCTMYCFYNRSTQYHLLLLIIQWFIITVVLFHIAVSQKFIFLITGSRNLLRLKKTKSFLLAQYKIRIYSILQLQNGRIMRIWIQRFSCESVFPVIVLLSAFFYIKFQSLSGPVFFLFNLFIDPFCVCIILMKSWMFRYSNGLLHLSYNRIYPYLIWLGMTQY